jgi:hypothetical protein
MTVILIVLGSVICLISLFAIAFPGRLHGATKSVTVTTPLRFKACGVRILFGVIMTLAAGSSRFPQTLRIIGILLIVVGVTVLLLGNARVQALMDWFLRRGPNAIRVGGIIGLLFGGFLTYAVV